MTERGSVRPWIWKLWCVAVIQEVVEGWMQAWLVYKFRSPVMCRVSIRDDRWCMVPSLTETMMRRVPAWRCAYDPWCGALIFSDTAPPLLTRLFVLMGALLVSLFTVWAPRLLTYRSSNTILVWARRCTPRQILLFVGTGAVLQLGLDHIFLPLVLPSSFLLTRTLSCFTFCCATLVMTGVLAVKVKQRSSRTHSMQQLTELDENIKQPKQHVEMKYWEEHTNSFGASYTLPDVCRHMVTDNAL